MSNKIWNKVKLGEIAEIIDSLHQTPTYSVVGYPMVRVTDINGGYLNLNNTFKVSKDVYELFSKKHKTKKGDLVMSRVGTYGIVSYINSNQEFCLGQNTLFIIPKQNSKYLYYFLSSPIAKIQIESFATGSTQKTISLRSIKEIVLSLPDLPTQTRIASILSAIDDKIELNRRINYILEQMAQTLFKKYFVDDVDPENLPVGWSSKPLNSFLDFLEGPGIRNWQYTEEGVRFINIRLIENGDINVKKASFISEEEANGNYKHFHLAENDMIMSSSGTLGKKAIVRKSHLPLMLNTSVIRFRPIDGFSRAYTYQYLSSSDFNDQLLSLASGSVQLNFGPMHLNQIKMLIPNTKLLEKYAKIANTLYDKIIGNNNEIDFLKSIRDTLLPKLMSGEINVEQVPVTA